MTSSPHPVPSHFSRMAGLLGACLAAACGMLGPQAWAQGQSSLVYPGADGRLVYQGYANLGQTTTGNRMIDFSQCGYMGGGVAIPWVPEEITLDPLPSGDDHARIQAAIDTVSALPLSPAGFRGAVLLRAGTYRVSQPLRIRAGGVVIRGAGQHTGGTVIQFTATVQSNLFDFAGSGGWTKIADTETPITDTLVPSGTRTFNVASTAGLAVGDWLMVHRTPNQAWIDLLQMGQYGWTPEGYRSQTPRVITAIDGNTITVDAPLVHAIESRYGGGEVFRYHFNGALRQVGIENIRLESSFTSDTDENHGWNAVVFNRVENGWARRVTARYFGFSCVNITGGSKFVTVEDCAQLDPKSIITGGRRYSFNLGTASFVLVQRCYTREGRHDYVTGSRVPGPNAFVDSLAENTRSDTGPHHRYAEGLLFDNVRAGAINVQNRRTSGTGHGWAGAQTVFWNCHATTMICDAPKAAMNFSIGNIGTQQQGQWQPSEPDGIWQSRGVPVAPRSLYYAQLADRLGHHAVATVTSTSQQQGTIWTQLSAWKGNSAAPGLPTFGPLRVDAGPTLYTEVATPVDIATVVRHPLPPDFQTTHTWTKASGPGNVTFGDPQNLVTTVQFDTNGTYTLECEVVQENAGESYTGTATLTVIVGFTPPPDPLTKIWTGSSGSSWETAANWIASGTPAANQNAVFTNASASGFSNHIGVTRTIQSITFDSSTAATPYTLHLANGLTLPIDTTTTRNLTLGAGGGVTVAAGHHTIRGLSPGSGTPGELKLSNNINFNIAANSSLTLSTRLSATSTSNTCTKSGGGTLVLTADNGGSTSWHNAGSGGLFTVSQGTLKLAASRASGFSGNKFTIASGATLEIAAAGAYGANNGILTLNGTGANGIGALHASTTTTIGAGNGSIIMASNSRVGVDDGESLTINLPLTGAGALEKSGPGTLVLGGINTYTTATTVSEGSLLIQNTSPATTGAVTVAESGRLGGNGETPAAVTVQPNGGLSLDISDWTGTAGIGFTDLQVGALAVQGALHIEVTSSTAFAGFAEADKVFPFLITTSGISGLDPEQVTVTTSPTFTGMGAWSVAQNGNTLELVYTAYVDPYVIWDAEYPLADLSNPADDHDGDGLDNFHEFAFGLDPTNPASVDPITDISQLKTAGIFSYTRRKNSGLEYTVWTSNDLDQWSEQFDVSQVPGVAIDGVETVLVTLDEIPGQAAMFLRVKATPEL